MSVMVHTMEELQAQPPGSSVLVAGVAWERCENGLMRDAAVLDLSHFVGYLADGRVEATAPWMPGRWYRNGNHWRLITGHVGDQVQSIGFAPRQPDPIFAAWAVTERPGQWLLVAASDEDTWMKRISALARDLSDQIPEPFVQVLHAYAANVNDAEFDDLLTEHGIARIADHVSTVKISGHSFWTPDAVVVKAWLGDETWTVAGIEEAVSVYWQRTVTLTTNGVGCTCGLIERDRVAEFVPSETDDFQFEVTCAQ